jgi:type I restriction enzyme S subunit
MRPTAKIHGQFAVYQILNREFIDIIDGSTFGAKMPRVSWEFMANMPCPTPPIPEQQTIATFLDRETAKIDALVAEQENLIALLKEKRQAVISHAVTKGLDPSVPMKDSGIEWLGEVPAHWEVAPLKRDIEFLTSGSRGWADHYADEGAIFIRIGNLTRGSLNLDLTDLQRVEVPEGVEGERTLVRPGDIVFSITAYLGSVAVIPAMLKTAYVSQHVALARLAKRLFNSYWVGYVTLSVIGTTHFDTAAYGGTKIQLSLGDVADLPITTPPLKEQLQIINYLDTETAKLDTLTAEAQRGIDLLKERRSALISAAVTGKIDVRGYRAQPPPII